MSTRRLQGNPTLLTLLEAGCRVTFPSGYSLHGDTRNRYIDLSHQFGSDGLRSLSRDGVTEALCDAAEYQREQAEVQP